LHDTLPVDLPDLWPSDILILAFVVFNPGDLYYLGYKKIIIIIVRCGLWDDCVRTHSHAGEAMCNHCSCWGRGEQEHDRQALGTVDMQRRHLVDRIPPSRHTKTTSHSYTLLHRTLIRHSKGYSRRIWPQILVHFNMASHKKVYYALKYLEKCNKPCEFQYRILNSG